jgi:ribosomal protein S18 acetylase RimI-like enzyme
MNCGHEEHDALTIVSAQSDDLERYLDLLEEVAAWLETRGIRQWPRGSFRGSAAYYSQSITQQEVQLAFIGDELVATLRVLLSEPIVWPKVVEEDAIYVYNLAVRRAWAELGLGRRLLDWASARAASLGRKHVRLDCVMDNDFLRDYYTQAGFEDRGEIETQFPPPVGALRLRRYEKRVCKEEIGRSVVAEVIARAAGRADGEGLVHRRTSMQDLAIEIRAVAHDSEEARALIRALDEDLRRRYPGIALHGLHPEDVRDRRLIFLIAHADGRAIGCGAARELEPSIGEVKRMFVQPAWRRQGVARQILAALETHARKCGWVVLRLETASGQPEAISLYRAAGYVDIPAFGEYVGNPASMCLEKRLI